MHFDNNIFLSHLFLNSICENANGRDRIVKSIHSSFNLCKRRSFSNGISFFTTMKVDLNDNSKLLLGSRNCGVSLVDLSPIYSPPKLVANEYIYPENSRHTCTSVDWFYDSQIFFTADTNGRLVVWNSQSFVVPLPSYFHA